MAELIRTFIAIELTPATRRILADAVSDLKGRTEANVRWVNPGNVHLTLKFLGNVDAAVIPSLVKSVQAAVGDSGPFRLALGNLGAFPNPARARVVWVGLEGAVDALLDLQRRVEQVATAMGLAEEQRPFAPHLTLGRVSNNPPTHRASLAAALRRGAAPLVGGFDAEEVVVMRSDLRPTGAVYTPLGRASL